MDTIKNSIFLLLSVVLLNGCSTVPQKRTPQMHIVEIHEMKFQPVELKVQAGDTVMWINRDIVAHNVTEEKNAAWASSPLVSGASWKMVVTQNVDYYCSIHVTMKGKIRVEI
jgi:plastocyanin